MATILGREKLRGWHIRDPGPVTGAKADKGKTKRTIGTALEGTTGGSTRRTRCDLTAKLRLAHAPGPASVYREAQISDACDLAWDDDDHPRKQSGVNGISALSLLPMFDIVWDVLPDWMHIIKNLILPHFIKLVKGKRDLIVPQYKTVPAPGSASTLEINAAVRYTPIHF